MSDYDDYRRQEQRYEDQRRHDDLQREARAAERRRQADLRQRRRVNRKADYDYRDTVHAHNRRDDEKVDTEQDREKHDATCRAQFVPSGRSHHDGSGLRGRTGDRVAVLCLVRPRTNGEAENNSQQPPASRQRCSIPLGSSRPVRFSWIRRPRPPRSRWQPLRPQRAQPQLSKLMGSTPRPRCALPPPISPCPLPPSIRPSASVGEKGDDDDLGWVEDRSR